MLELERERQGRAMATLDGCQGTEPGHKEDKREGDGVKLKVDASENKSEGADDGKDVKTKGWREGTEDPQKWLKQGRKRKSRKDRGKQ